MNKTTSSHRRRSRHLKLWLAPLVVALLFAGVAACDPSVPQNAVDAGAATGADGGAMDGGEEALVTDWCDEDALSEVDFAPHISGSFRVFYLPGTAAERDLADIVSVREEALTRISTALEITETRSIEIDIAPNRLAAVEHNIGAGLALPDWATLQILYLDDPESYERKHYGHELMHVMAYHLDEPNQRHWRILEEGLAEFFDQSGRDLHQVYFQECQGYGLPLASALAFNRSDTLGHDYGKAGSFVSQLFSLDDDPDTFKALYRDCRQSWQGDTPITPEGVELTGPVMEEILDTLLQQHYGVSFADFRAAWLDTLQAYGPEDIRRPSEEDQNQIKSLMATRDDAIRSQNSELLRATMEGFACDITTDQQRSEAVAADLHVVDERLSTVTEVYDFGLRNYAVALVVYTVDNDPRASSGMAEVEHYPLGWRVNWVFETP